MWAARQPGRSVPDWQTHDWVHAALRAQRTPDRPATTAEAQARFAAHLDHLAESAPRVGLGATTGAFVDDPIKRASRYGDAWS